MDKKEILKKSRVINNDEGVEFVENKGRKIGVSLIYCIIIFITIFNTLIGRKSLEIFAIFWALTLTESIPKYRFTQKKIYLVTIISSLIGMIAALLGFIMVSLR